MGLVPVTGVLETIAKLERKNPEAARALVVMALHDSLAEQVDALRPNLEPAILREMGEIAKEAKASLRRVSVTKALATGELHGQAEADALDAVTDYVTKGLIGSILERFNRQHPRDSEGRFVRVEVQGSGNNRATVRHSSAEQAKSKVQEMARLKLVNPDTLLTVHTRNTHVDGLVDTGGPESKTTTTAAGLEEQLGNLREGDQVTGVSIRRGDLPKGAKGNAKLDIMGMLSNQDVIGSQRLLDRVERTNAKFPDKAQAAGNWYAPSAGGENMDRQAYRRLKATGQVLSGLSTPGSGMSVAGGVAQLVGEIGPEAEKVLGPGIRRAAYRYRGTERRPSGDLRNQVTEAQDFAEGKGNFAQRSQSNPAAAIGLYHNADTISEDQRDLLVGGDATVAWMLGLTGGKSQLPDKKSAELSIASGEVPPSRGVIIDADGDLVSQAVGFNGDHYLPFDLRNLGRLYGGQYVRTRALGGPTGEDLYAAVMTGARQFQVVSNSGVFTVEFDPNLRGGKRYGDKARRMVQRYEQMLETLNDPSKAPFERDLLPEQRTEIRRKAAAASTTPEQFRDQVRTMENQARMMGALATEEGDDDAAMEAATGIATTRVGQEIDGMPQALRPSKQGRLRMIDERRRQEYERLTGGQVKRMSLNGAGYDRALQALQAEFPYFIRRADWQQLPEWKSVRGIAPDKTLSRDRANDRGYVEPGQTNPAIGREGVNARRTVPGLKAGQKVVRDETTQGGGPAATTTTTSTPVPAAQPKQADYTIAALIKPGAPMSYAIADPAGALLQIASDYPPVSTYQGDPAKIDQANDHTYVSHMANQILNSGPENQSGQRFAQWYFNEATPHQREKILRGFKGLDKEINQFPEIRDTLVPQLEAEHDRLIEALDLVDPYAPVGKDDVAVTAFFYDPKSDRAKPVSPDKLGLDVSLDSEPEEIKRALQRLANGDPEAEKLLEDMKDDHNVEHAESAFLHKNRFAGSGKEEDLEQLGRVHKIWSLLHTLEVAEQLRKLTGGGASGPKVEKAHRPRRVIVHKADEPFTKRTLAALGIG